MKMNLWLLIATASAMALTGCQRESSDAGPQAARAASAANPFDQFDEPLETLQARAEGGDPEAQAALGSLHYKGKGIPQDSAKAADWWRRAAEQGYRAAQFDLGGLYFDGNGVAKDHVQAVEWWRRAAEQGSAAAQFNLGLMYSNGSGVAKDLAQAVAWWTKAAEKGDAYAQYMLGESYSDGTGVPNDDIKAVEWWHKAAAQGDSDAQRRLGQVYASGRGVPKDDIKAFEWSAKAASNGHPWAQAAVGLAYIRGRGVPKDDVLGYAWLNLAAAQGISVKEMRDSLSLSVNQLAEGQRLSTNWTKGQALNREGSRGGEPAAGGTLAKQGTGTAFWVSKTGYAITNNHVVDGCREVRASGRDAVLRVVTTDAANDIALLQLAESVPQVAAVSSASPPVRQGDNVVVFGFPLNAVLSSGGNITPGVVSALTGLGNDTNQIQITAPIQPGSSGSPVLNMKGEVVGVAMGKLSDSKVSRATGQVPQNVNFAVNGQTLKTFLDTHKVEYRTGGMLTFSKTAADLADEARKWTLVVECWR